MYIYLFPFGFQYTFTTLPQLGHFSDTMIHPEPVSPISQARFLHRLSGHFIFRIIPPPLPQNTSIAISPHRYVEREPDRHMVLSLLGSLLSFVYYWFSSCSPIPQSAGTPGMPALPCQAVAYRGYTFTRFLKSSRLFRYPCLCFPVKRRLLIQIIRQCFKFLPLTIL